MNMEKTEAMRISRQPLYVEVMVIRNGWIMWNISADWVAG